MSLSRSAAFELFGEMRHSTPEEQEIYRRMIEKYSVPIKKGMNIMDFEMGTCKFCGVENVPIQRKYYYYDIDCKCCGTKEGYHFEIVKHCKDCAPRPPRIITAEMEPINE